MVPEWSLGLKLSYKTYIILFWCKEGSRINLFWARLDIYAVNFDLFIFIEGVIFQKGHSNIKVVFWYGDSRFQGFLVISSHFDRKFQVWNIFYLVTKSLIQLLIENAGGCWGETYIKWKAWMSSFWKKWSKLETFGDLAVVRFLKNDNVQSHQRWQHMI